MNHKSYEVVFLTDFSDACFRATRAVAQMADELEMSLTIVYARKKDEETRQVAEEKLRSFFPEADRYRACRRIVAETDVVSAVTELRERRPIDLVVAPVPDRFKLPRVFHSSIRGRLLNDLGLNVWTIGRGVKVAKLGAVAKNIACVIDGGRGHDKHIEAALAYAQRRNATLHLLHVMPEVDEGALMTPSGLLSEADVAERFKRIAAGSETRVEIHVSTGGSVGELRRIVEARDIDVMFVDERRAVSSSAFASRMSKLVDMAPCPTVCVSKAGLGLEIDSGKRSRALKVVPPQEVPAMALKELTFA